jgi:DNA-binding transcriptional LysR family regulator
MRPEDRIGRRLTLRDFNIFLAVVEQRSMSRAASHLAVSQPVVSKAIADMEHTLRVRLLDRDPRGIEPTLYGRALIKRGMAIFDELRQSVKDIESLADPTAGETRIGGTGPLVAGVVPAVADKLVRQYPRVVIEVIEGDFATLLIALRERKIDLAIGRAPEPVSDEDMVSEVLFEDRLLVVTGSRNKWTRRQKVNLGDLLGEPWVFPSPGTISSVLVAEAFHAAGIKPPRAAVLSSSMAMNIHLLTAGRFLALLPASTVLSTAKHQPLKALPVALPDQRRPVVIATLKNRTLSPTAKLFVDCARTVTR